MKQLKNSVAASRLSARLRFFPDGEPGSSTAFMGLARFLITVGIVLFLWRVWRAWWLGLNQPNAGKTGPAPRPVHRPSPHQVLGVSESASPEEIRRAYQALVQQYHPDHVAHLGPELRDVAERRTKEITAAYNALKQKV